MDVETLSRHLAAVMFTDMAGYTALMQKDEAAALRSRERHRSALDQALEGRGRVLQYFGDGSLCVFSSSLEAVQAAIDIQRALAGDPALRIGLHAGEIAYDVQGAYGDAVNIAARLEAICAPGGITISQKIYDDIQRHPNLPAVPSGTVRLKNIRQSVPTYALSVDGLTVPSDEASGAERDGLEDESGLPAPLLQRLEQLGQRAQDPLRRIAVVPGRVPLVGRDREVELLRDTLQTAESGRGATVFLRGPRGVGKTRLAQEVAEHARARGWSVLSGRAHPSQRLVAYAPFSDALMPLLRGLDVEALSSLTPGNDAALCSLFPALGSAPSTSDVSWSVLPGESRVRLYWQFASMLAGLAAHRPLLITLEDLDFADRASLELFEFVSRQARSEPIVFIAEYTGSDPDRLKVLRALEQSLIMEGTGKVLELAPLDEAGTIEFIREALDLEESEARRLGGIVYDWSRGNPFFVTGTLRGLVESGALRREEGRWSTVSLDDIRLPHTVRDAVLVWMGHLSGTAIEVARTLAMIGREVDYELVQFVTQLEGGVISDALDELARHQVVAESESQWTLSYALRSPILSEVLRDELPLARRRELHGRIAESLERYYGDGADDHADELAYHCGRAHPGVFGLKAIHYLVLAGERALGRHANQEAAAYLQEAFDRIGAAPPGVLERGGPGDVPRDRILLGLARARRRLGEVSASVAIWRRLLATARERQSAREIARLHRAIGLTYMAGGALEEAIEEFAAATEWASAAGQLPLVVRSQLAQGQCFQAAGRVTEAEEALRTSLILAEEFGQPDLLAQVYRSITHLKMWTGPISEAQDAARRAIELSRTSGNLGVAFWSRWAMAAMEGLIGHTEAMAHYIASAKEIVNEVGSPLFELAVNELELELHYARGEWNQGVDLGHRAIDMARASDAKLILPRLLVWTSQFHLGRGQLDLAERLTDEAWKVSGAARADDVASFMHLHAVVPAHIGRASVALARGQWEEASRIAAVGLRIADRSGYTVWSFHHILPIMGEAAIHARDLDKASAVGRRMREEAERLDHPLGLAWASACDAVVTWLTSDARTGATSLRAGAEALEAIPMTHSAAKLRRQLAGRLAEIGEEEEALRELTAAYRVFQRLGARPEEEKAEGQFRELGADVPQLAERPST